MSVQQLSDSGYGLFSGLIIDMGVAARELSAFEKSSAESNQKVQNYADAILKCNVVPQIEKENSIPGLVALSQRFIQIKKYGGFNRGLFSLHKTESKYKESLIHLYKKIFDTSDETNEKKLNSFFSKPCENGGAETLLLGKKGCLGESNEFALLRYSDNSFFYGILDARGRPLNGTIAFDNGNTYVGEFKNGQQAGKGTYTWVNGTKYVGDFKNGQQTGKGTLTFKNGNKYEGEFENDQQTGKGTYTWVDGTKYVGEFKNGQRAGKGTYTWVDGTKYVGDFKDGEQTGSGAVFFQDQPLYSGSFLKRSLIKLDEPEKTLEIFARGVLGRLPCGVHRVYPLSVISSLLPSTSNVGKALSSALDLYALTMKDALEATKKVYSELVHNKKSQLLCFGTSSHAMGLNLVPVIIKGKDYIDCEIYNSGLGLGCYHIRSLDQKKYQTRKIIRIPLEQVTKKNIGELLRLPILNPDDIDEIYQTILNINGAEVITPEVPVWQTDQKGPNCSFEWIFAYLKHQLTPNEYNEFRYKLFVSFSKLPSVNGDDRERLFKKIEKRKSRLGIEDQAQVEVPDLFDPKFREHLFSLSHNQMKKF